MPEQDLRKRIADILGKLPRPAELTKWKAMGPLTAEEEHYVMKIINKVGEMNALTFVHPLINHKRIDAVLRRKIAELEELLPKVRH